MATFVLLSNAELTELARCCRIAAKVEREHGAAQSAVSVSLIHEHCARQREDLADWLEAARRYPPLRG